MAESYVHLCASGLGVDRLHLLLIDVDTTNGNVTRTINTINAYQRLSPWGWKVRATIGKDKRSSEFEFFKTEINFHELRDSVQDVLPQSLRRTVRSEDGSQDVLDLLYNEKEQTTDCGRGFLAMPNLGCLLMAEHLDALLAAGQRGSRFVDALKLAARDGGGVRVAVAASLFGGTGASLFPVIIKCIRRALGNEADDVMPHMRWGAIMMLPYFSRVKV